jgi:hypothetical protein
MYFVRGYRFEVNYRDPLPTDLAIVDHHRSD